MKCEQCGIDIELKRYLVYDGDETTIAICDECIEWLEEGRPEYDYVEISQIK